MKKKKMIVILLLLSFAVSLFLLVAVVGALSGAYEQYMAASHKMQDNQNEDTEIGDIQAGIAKGKRTAYPSSDNPFFFSSKYNAFVGTPYGPPAISHNCTWYAYGRFGEILGKKPALPTSNAGEWYWRCTAYKKGQTPKVGAVVVWSYFPYGAGHVAVIEEVKANGDIVTSNSGWSGADFWMQTWSKSSGYSNYKFRLEGFIYQP